MSAPTRDPVAPHEQGRRTGIARWIALLSVPIIIGWVVIVALVNVTVPQLEVVGQMRSVSMSPAEAPSVIAMKRSAKSSRSIKSDSAVMILLEGDAPLGAEARRETSTNSSPNSRPTPNTSSTFRTSGVIRSRRPARRARTGKAAYVQVYLTGEALSNESVEQVIGLVDE